MITIKKSKASILGALALIILSLGWSACNKATSVGTDLFADEFAEVVTTDTFTLTAETILVGDSVEAYRPGSPFGVQIVGDINDPDFGQTTAEFYAQLFFSTNQIPDFSEAVIDSLVYSLEYQANACFGDTSSVIHFGVYKVTENMPDSISISTKQTYAYDPIPVGTYEGNFSITDSVKVYEPSGTNLVYVTYPPQMRIRLNSAFAQQLMDIDTSYYSTKKEEFLSQFPGLLVKPIGPQNVLVAFDMNETPSRMALYYHVNATDTVQRVLVYDSFNDDLRFTHVTASIAGSPASAAINNPESSDRMYVQGLLGTDLKLNIPYLKALKNKVSVHKAELEIYALDSADILQPTVQLLMATVLTADTITLVDDSFLAAVNNALDVLGGAPERVNIGGVDLWKYRINFTSHAQKMVDEENDAVLYLTKYLRMQSPRRSVFFGPNHPLYPAKVRLYYTTL